MRSAQATTTVTFEGLGHNEDIPQTFADNASISGTGFDVSLGLAVTGTPNIDLTWGQGFDHQVDSYQNWDGRGSVAQLDFTRDNSNPITITFTPDASWGVLINSFDMDEFSGGGLMSVDWSITDGIGTLASGNWSRSTGGRDTIFTGLGAGDINIGQTVSLTFQGLSGTGSYFALDNLVFDQVPVPEPSAMTLALLGGLGLGAAAMRRRRK